MAGIIAAVSSRRKGKQDLSLPATEAGEKFIETLPPREQRVVDVVLGTLLLGYNSSFDCTLYNLFTNLNSSVYGRGDRL